jgi:hypothetical protein
LPGFEFVGSFVKSRFSLYLPKLFFLICVISIFLRGVCVCVCFKFYALYQHPITFFIALLPQSVIILITTLLIYFVLLI